MNKLLIKATFRGADRSLGYRFGERYDLVFKRFDQFKSFLYGYPISVERIAGSGFCPYSNSDTFERNWQEVEVINTL